MRAPAHTWQLRVHVQPRASRNRIVGRYGAAVKIQVQAAPVEGAANAALIELLAAVLAVPRGAIRILHGATGREKVVAVDTADPAGCEQRLRDALEAVAARVDKGKGGG